MRMWGFVYPERRLNLIFSRLRFLGLRRSVNHFRLITFVTFRCRRRYRNGRAPPGGLAYLLATARGLRRCHPAITTLLLSLAIAFL